MVEAFSIAFYNALKADASLKTKLGGSAGDTKIYHVIAPQIKKCPYLTYGMLTDVPEGTLINQAAMEFMTFFVNVFSTTNVENCMEIADLVKAAMDDTSLTITGYSHMICMREYTSNVMYQNDTQSYQIHMRYKVWGSKN